MLRSIKNIIGYAIRAKDGDIGKVIDFYFDDDYWTIRYLVADTGNWLFGKRVLISPAAFFGQPDWEKQEFPVIFTKDMVEKCPDIDTDKPISRQMETELITYYGWPMYWQQFPGVIAGSIPMPIIGPLKETSPINEKDEVDAHLRSCREVEKYHIQAKDGTIGHVEDFIVDDEYWGIRYMVVDTRNWLPGRRVLVALHWIKKISWADSEVSVDLTQKEVRNSPIYDPTTGVNREYEERLYDYYGRPKYW